MNASIPTVLDEDLPDYEILEVLGSGSTSTVYKATQLSLGRVVAIKRFAPDALSRSADLGKRFRREAAIWGQLHHENLVHLYDFKTTEHAQYIILEYCNGFSLREIMDVSARIPPEVVCSLMHQVFSAVEYLHQRGIVHRDLKPANIFITNDGLAKLLDFGISTSSELDPITLPGSVIGTPAYMSPEQAIGKRAEPYSDIFSLGAVMFEMLDGRKAFRSNKLNELVQEIANGNYRSLSARSPRAYRSFVRKCLRQNPKDRHKSMAMMRVWAEEMLAKHEVYVPKNRVRDFLVEKKLFRGKLDYTLFPGEIAKGTAQGPLGSAFSDVQTHISEEHIRVKRKKKENPGFILGLLLVAFAAFLYLDHPFMAYAEPVRRYMENAFVTFFEFTMPIYNYLKKELLTLIG